MSNGVLAELEEGAAEDGGAGADSLLYDWSAKCLSRDPSGFEAAKALTAALEEHVKVERSSALSSGGKNLRHHGPPRTFFWPAFWAYFSAVSRASSISASVRFRDVMAVDRCTLEGSSPSIHFF